ncbi:MAG: UDPglucose--hexose-phosphate uridylyltransferase [Clostridiales bacterium]|nr:UDPglucose--hexose-phosphate uridylyltransferase [Clostridiales bacterium]
MYAGGANLSQFRRDIVTGDWVIIAQERSGRPYHYGDKADKNKCPFCPGNEYFTPNEIMRISNESEWELRVVPNKFPVVCIEDGTIDDHTLFYSMCQATGTHEIVIETPSHHQALHHLPKDKIFNVFSVFKQRFVELSKREDIKYVQIFKNNGKNGGASIPHAHSQIVALPFIPPRIEREMEGARQYFERENRCIFCAIIEKELECQERLLCKNDAFVAVSYFAPRFPYETWIIPLKHQQVFSLADDDILYALADAFKNVMDMMLKTLGEFPYNIVLHTAPYGFSDKYYHWHIELIPRVAYHAGFELATGSCVNDISPEEVAQKLKKK